MMFATPIGLLALLAIPAIVAIHLFRRRFPVRSVAGLFLWQARRRTPEGGGRIAKLPITWSLLLECLAALALALILAGARLSPTEVSRHLVVLLDHSASMAAVNAQGESARDRAVRRILAEIERLPASARVTFVQSGDRPAVLVGPAALAVEAAGALASWHPDAPHHSLALGLRLARELAGTTGALMVISDVTPETRGEEHFQGGLWISAGQALTNVGITAAQRTRVPEEGRSVVSLTLLNTAATPSQRRLSVSAGDKEALARDIDVPPGVSSVTVPLPAGLPTVRVSLSGDALTRDDQVMLAESRPQIVGVDNQLPEGRGRQALEKALAAVTGVTTSAMGHLVFVDGATIAQPGTPGAWRIGFGRAPASWAAAGAPQDFAGPFVLEKRHPLLSGVTLGGVVWAGAVPVTASAVHPIVSAGDRALIALAAASATMSRADPAILFNIDLTETNLIRAPDWPILISNLVEMRRLGLPGPERWNYRIGEWVRARLEREPKAPLRVRCGPVERPLPAGRQLEFLAPSPGGALQVLEGDAVLFEIGVNFLDEHESQLRQQTTTDAGQLVEGAGLRAEGGAASDPLFWVLLVIGGAAVLINWILLARARGSL